MSYGPNDNPVLYLESLQEQLKEANKVIAFYANQESWGFDDCTLDYAEVDSSDLEIIHPVSKARPNSGTGGKRAREYEKKHMIPK